VLKLAREETQQWVLLEHTYEHTYEHTLGAEVGAGGDSAMGVVSGAGIRHFLGSAGVHSQK
jgi:hypothetical protein